ncbi:MAG: tetratricopeptide repeat protein [Planctomycetota bacterium]|jgi:tetratricopeptide (TPR) repeat protein
MDKKQVVILLILTNVISVGLVSLFLSQRQTQHEKAKTPPSVAVEPKDVQEKEKEPEEAVDVAIDSVIAQYDLIKSGRYQDAVEAYKQAMRREPPYTADSTLARRYAELGYYEKAMEACEKEIQDFPHDAANYYTLAWIYAKIGRYEKAIQASKRATEAHPRYAKIWHVLAWVYAKLGEQDKAVDACNQALKVEPYSPQVHYGLGRIYGMLADHEKAIESYKEAIRLKADYTEAYLFLGLTYAELGDTEEAIKSYRKTIELDRYYPEPRFFLGIAYDESGQYKEAIEALNEAIRYYYSDDAKARIHAMGIRPDLANVRCIVGVCNLRIGQPFEASLAFKQAIDIDASHAGAHYGLALTHLLLGDKEAALEKCEQVKALKGEEAAKSLLDIISGQGE